MREVSELLIEIKNGLNIPKRPQESEQEHLARVAYSLAGRWALASLSDTNSEGIAGFVSVHHFKKAFINVFRAINPSGSDDIDLNKMADYIYDQYRNGGFYYQQGKTLSNSVYKECSLNQVLLLRGMRASELVYMSGLGPYKVNSAKQSDDLSNFWDLKLDTLRPLLEHYLHTAHWEQYQGNGAYVSILDIKASLNGFRWSSDVDQVSLARTTVEPYRYFLSKTKNIGAMSYLFVSYLPDFFKTEQIWIDLASAFIQNYHGRLKCKIYRSGEYYLYKMNELPLPRELRSFLNIYSWPLKYLYQDNQSNYLIKKEIIDSLIPLLAKNCITFETYS